MAARKPLIAGNWKMYGRRAALNEALALPAAAGQALTRIEALICPPSVYVAAAAQALAGHAVSIGAQDCSPSAEDGARTGEVSAAMLADAGAAYVIVGHSERRSYHNEGDDVVREKAQAAQAAGLSPIVCVGESETQRSAGRARAVVAAQVCASIPSRPDGLVVAYEPIWAIGGSRTPTLDEIRDIHAVVRRELAGRFSAEADAVRVLYGGSVNPANAGDIFAVDGVDGALVGRASLKAADFAAIIRAHPAAL